MMRIFGSLVLVFCLAFSACQLDADVQGKIEIGIKDEIVLRLSQILSPSGTSLQFVIQSITPYDCEGAGFQHQTHTSPGQIRIRLLHVDVPEPCVGGQAPAQEFISVPGYPGTYALTFGFGPQIENKGTLRIDEKGYFLNMDSDDGMSIPNTSMLRIPEGTIWGYVYHAEKQQLATMQLYSFLAQHINAFEHDPGYYGHFQIIAPEQISFPLPEGRYSASAFIFRFGGPSSSLESLVEEARQQLPDGSELVVHSWIGRVY